MINKKLKNGFTLIEIIVVILLIGLLTFLLISSYVNSLKRGRDSKRKSDLDNISIALELYNADMGRYPIASEFSILTMLCNTKDGCTQVYMARIPKDPLTNKSYYYESDESGSYFRIYSNLELSDDKSSGVNQDGYSGNCDPTPCKYGQASTNTDLITLAESNSPAGQLKKDITPTPTIIDVFPTATDTPTITNLDYFEIKYEGLSSNTYYPMFKYQTLDIRCPKGYGVRDIKVKNKDTSRNDVKFMGCSLNEWSYKNDLGAACAFAADSPFEGQMTAVCDKNYFDIILYTPSQISTLSINNLPDKFYLGDWFPQMTTKINDQQQDVSVTCPSGYKATNITCSMHFINYTSLNSFYQINGLISMTVDSVRTATCKYDAKNSFYVWITTICDK